MEFINVKLVNIGEAVFYNYQTSLNNIFPEYNSWRFVG